MPASVVASLRVIKTFSFKGVTREWSNRYYFFGSPPADATHWTTLSDAVVLAEKAVYTTRHTIVRTHGYLAGTDVPAFTKVYATAGTLAAPGGLEQAGEVCMLVRYETTVRSVKNHPVYAYNYYHGVQASSGAAPDTPVAAMNTALSTYAAAWVTGFNDGTTNHVRATPSGNVCVGRTIRPFLTHRDFPPA